MQYDTFLFPSTSVLAIHQWSPTLLLAHHAKPISTHTRGAVSSQLTSLSIPIGRPIDCNVLGQLWFTGTDAIPLTITNPRGLAVPHASLMPHHVCAVHVPKNLAIFLLLVPTCQHGLHTGYLDRLAPLPPPKLAYRPCLSNLKSKCHH